MFGINAASLHGVIVDGRNRFRACEMLGRKPKIKEMQFANETAVISYIISTNIHRRHLTESQRAMIASELAQLDHGVRSDRVDASIEASRMTQAEAADQMQVSRASVQRAREVQQSAPDLAAKVKSGEMKVSKAASIARERTKVVEPPTDISNAAHSTRQGDFLQSLQVRLWTGLSVVKNSETSFN